MSDQKNCGNCGHYKGAKAACGQSAYIPQGDTDHCMGRNFKPKTSKPAITVSKLDREVMGRWIEEYRQENGITVPLQALEREILHRMEHKVAMPPEYERIKKEVVVDLETVGLGLAHKPYYSYSKKEETKTMSNAIIKLADSQFTKEIADFGGLNVDLREALQDMQAQQKKDAAIAAAKEVMGVLNRAEQSIEANVEEIRRARKAEANAKAHIEKINRAKAYGLATNNFVPLAVELGLVNEYNVENKDLLKIDDSKIPKATDGKEAV